MDTWLASEVLVCRDEFQRDVIPVPVPVTVLDEEPIEVWFRAVEGLDREFYAQLRFLVLRKSLGFEPTPLLSSSKRSPYEL